MSKVNVSFTDPEHGWMGVNIQTEDQTIEIDASDVSNAFFPLVDTLLLLNTASGQNTVTWTCEPVEYDLLFQRTGEIVSLRISVHPNSHRMVSQPGETVLSVSGDYDGICLPFWRAMRHLQARFSKTDLEERWTNTFPYQELDRLTELLRNA